MATFCKETSSKSKVRFLKTIEFSFLYILHQTSLKLVQWLAFLHFTCIGIRKSDLASRYVSEISRLLGYGPPAFDTYGPEMGRRHSGSKYFAIMYQCVPVLLGQYVTVRH